jgi:hypothetical protein
MNLPLNPVAFGHAVKRPQDTQRTNCFLELPQVLQSPL